MWLWIVLLEIKCGFGSAFPNPCLRFRPFFFFFFSQCMNSNITWIYCAGDKKHCSCTVHGSHGTIHTFKNYIVTVFSVFSFLFQQKKVVSKRILSSPRFFTLKLVYFICFFRSSYLVLFSFLLHDKFDLAMFNLRHA